MRTVKKIFIPTNHISFAMLLCTSFLFLQSEANAQKPNQADSSLLRMKYRQMRQDTLDRMPNNASIKVFTRSYNDSVVIRWAPTKPGAWIAANQIGYTIKRYSFSADGKMDKSSMKKLTSVPIKPWTLAEWKERIKDKNKYAAIAAQGLYGKSFTQMSPGGAEGSSQIKNAIDELNGRFGFSLIAADFDAVTAEGLGLRFVDKSVEAEKKYFYVVSLATKDSIYKITDGFYTGSAHDEGKAAAPIELTAEGLQHKVTLSWRTSGTLHKFSGYYIYRSDDGGKTYHQLNKDPHTNFTGNDNKNVNPTYTDTNAINYKVYKYRVAGLTPFAELSEYAEIEGSAKDITPPPAPFLKTPKDLSSSSLKLEWEFADTTGKLAGFLVLRSMNSLENYHPLVDTNLLKNGKDIEAELMKHLLPKSARQFVDERSEGDEPYYMVEAVDTAGNASQSLPVYAPYVDTFPPSIPTGFAGTMDTNGVVTLHWNIGPESNLFGYRLFTANDPSHEFTPRNGDPIQDTSFTDTVSVQTLTHNIYYKIAAVKKTYSNSKFSPILAVKRPDLIPPVPPVFTDVFVTDRSINLHWNKSSSDDIAGYILSRRQSETDSWQEILTVKADIESYTDTAVSKNTDYQYRLTAFDTTGNRAYSPYAVHGKPYDNGIRPGVNGLNASYDAEEKSVKLFWSYAGNDDYWFVLYRSLDDSPLIKYQSIEKTNNSFSDSQLQHSKKAQYAVKVLMKNGKESFLSDKVSVVIK